MKLKRLTPAFSMLELVFVIAILGIVASIGAEMVAKVYEGYIVQRAEHKATMKTELAATQIANRLASAIPGTVYRKNTGETVIEEITDDMSLAGDQYTILQWVGSAQGRHPLPAQKQRFLCRLGRLQRDPTGH